MDEILRLLRQRLASLGDETFASLERVRELSDDELLTLEKTLLEAFLPFGEGFESDNAYSIDLTAMGALADAIDGVRAQQLVRRVAEPNSSPPTEPPPQAAEAVQNRPSPGQIASRLPASHAPRPREQDVVPMVTRAGGEIADRDALIEEFRRAMRGFSAHRSTIPGRELLSVVTARREFPAERQLTDSPERNAAIVAAAVSPQALVAAGGLCAPVSVSYDVPTIATAERPVRDGLPDFEANRGGIRFLAPPLLSDVEDGVGVWTVANDMDPGSDGPERKPFIRIECGAEQEVLIEAITRSLRAGNLNARSFPEQIAATLELLIAQHARLAETRLIASMVANSAAVTAARTLGATRDLLEQIDRATSAYRSRHRMPATAQLRCIFPSWVRDAVRADLARELPGSTAERLAVAETEIDRFFSSRAVSPIFSIDWQPLGDQPDGAVLRDWPGTVQWLLFHEGAHLFLDGGTLDLGLVRDSELNRTNEFEIFAETFENVAFVGLESLAITSELCVSGATAGTVDVTCQ